MGLLAVVVLFVQSSKTGMRDSDANFRLSGISKIDASTTLSVVRTSQGILSAAMTLILSNAFELLQGSLMTDPAGLPYLNMLALSPATGVMGLFKLLFSENVSLSTRLWVLLR